VGRKLVKQIVHLAGNIADGRTHAVLWVPVLTAFSQEGFIVRVGIGDHHEVGQVSRVPIQGYQNRKRQALESFSLGLDIHLIPVFNIGPNCAQEILPRFRLRVLSGLVAHVFSWKNKTRPSTGLTVFMALRLGRPVDFIAVRKGVLEAGAIGYGCCASNLDGFMTAARESNPR
jgi:hypothetical protein